MKLLVTSRAPLRLSAERVYPVRPLETPDGDDDLERVLHCDSVALFEERAQAVRPDFAYTLQTHERSRTSAERSTGCRWRSSLRPRALAHCLRRPCASDSTTG